MTCAECPYLGQIRVEGDGRYAASVALIGEAPGVQEERTGVPFVGQAGRELDGLLALARWSRSDIYVDNIVQCRPPTLSTNVKPCLEAIRQCRERLDGVMLAVDPDVVILLGSVPQTAIAPELSVGKHHGLAFVRELWGRERVVVLMYHPAATFYNAALKAVVRADWTRLRDVLKSPARSVRGQVYAWGVAPSAPVVAFDTENNIGDGSYVGSSMCVEEGKAFFTFDLPNVQTELLVGHNLKYDLCVVKRGCVVAHKYADTMIAAFLCGEPALGLKILAARHFGIEMDTLGPMMAETTEHLLEQYLDSALEIGFPSKAMAESLCKVLDADDKALALSRRARLRGLIGEPPSADVGDVARWMPERLMRYGCADADMTLRLWHRLEPELARLGMTELFWNVEMPLVPVLMRMEQRGLAIDNARACALDFDYEWEMRVIARRLVGFVDNPASNPQVAEAFYAGAEYEPIAWTEGGQPSVARWVLERLALSSPQAQDILDWRQLAKLRSTYLEPWADCAGRIHPEFNQVVQARDDEDDAVGATATGRTSSRSPNFQNVPSRTKRGREVRSCVCAEPGHVLVSPDYSQLEYMLMLVDAGDNALLDAFRNGDDAHALAASAIFGVPVGEVTTAQRYVGKTFNFAWGYGAQGWTIAKMLWGYGIRTSAQEVDALRLKFEKARPRLTEWWHETARVATVQGYTETFWGRRRYVPEIQVAQTHTEWREAAKKLVNHRIQGTAADICKLGLVLVDEYLENQGLCSDTTGVIAIIHDEFPMELRREDLTSRVVDGIIRAMQRAAPEFPLGVGVKVGANWGEMTKFAEG